MEWHVPSEEEMQFASQLMVAVLQPELDVIKNISINTISRQDTISLDSLNDINTISTNGICLNQTSRYV